MCSDSDSDCYYYYYYYYYLIYKNQKRSGPSKRLSRFTNVWMIKKYLY